MDSWERARCSAAWNSRRLVRFDRIGTYGDASLAVSGVMLLVWLFFFTRATVRTGAFTFAQLLLRACEGATADWPSAQVHVEYFTAKAAPAREGGFVVELARSGREFFIPAGHSILSVLLDEGIDVDYSCELGICGACETRVISGIPEHHDSVLSEEEQAENTRVMICCAGCKTERLVLDM